MSGKTGWTTAERELLDQAVDYRISDRQAVTSRTVARNAASGLLDVNVVDFSRDGCRFTSKHVIPIGSIVSLGLSGAGSALCEVIWARNGQYGCRFEHRLGDADAAQAFTGSTVVSIRSPGAGLPEPAAIGQYSRRTRLLLLLGAAAASWAVVIAAVSAIS